MKRFIKWIKELIERRRLRKKLKALAKKPPFIYF